MIVETVMNLLKLLITTIFGVLPNIPNIPQSMQNSILSVINTIFDNLSLIGIFIRPQTIIICVPILLVISNFEKIYEVTLWILKKIPFLGMK